MRWLAERLVTMFGWQIDGVLPPYPKMVIVGAPHTSNWDFVLFLAVVHHFDMRVNFLIKKSFFVGPLGWMMRSLGGIPVDRSSHHNLVDSVVASFDGADRMMLVLTPEGTRAKTTHWKSGFWRIAEAADVPVLMAFIDAERKRTGLGPALKIEGDPATFMAEANEFYRGMDGIRPESRTPVQL